MAEAITGPFAEALAANRERFNAKFAQAKRERPHLDGAAFLEVLRFSVAPLVEKVAEAAPARSAEAAEALYDLALDLLGQGVLGPASRYPAVAAGWGDLLPHLGRFLAQDPRRVAGSVSNALYHLSSTPGARPGAWSELLLRAAVVSVDVDTVLQAGQVAAWRAGLAHFRRGALALCRTLPAEVVRAVLELPAALEAEAVPAFLDRVEACPWQPTERLPGAGPALALVARAGAFRGFGGLFLRPPRVTLAGEDFYVQDGDGTWLLAADVYGATFHRAEPRPPTPALTPYSLKADGTLSLGAHTRRFPALAQATSHAANRTTLAVTTALSHSVFLIALADS